MEQEFEMPFGFQVKVSRIWTVGKRLCRIYGKFPGLLIVGVEATVAEYLAVRCKKAVSFGTMSGKRNQDSEMKFIFSSSATIDGAEAKAQSILELLA